MQSTGWNNNRNVMRLLEFMARRGEVATAGRRGAERLWDLADRVYPDDPVVPAEEALRIRNQPRLRALGTLEMYKPASSRRWGYSALPILYGDRLVGKFDATADRSAGVLRVNAIHQDVTFDKAMTAAIDLQIKDLADWLELEQHTSAQ